MRRVLAVARKEFIQVVRDPRTLAVMVVIPPLWLLLFGYGITLDVTHLRTAVCDLERTPSSRALISRMASTAYFDVLYRLDDPRQADELLDHGRVRAVVVIPADFTRRLGQPGGAQAQVLLDGSDPRTASLANGYLLAVIQDYAAELAVARLKRAGQSGALALPLDLRDRARYNPELKSVNFIIPGLIAIILMLLAALLTSLTVVRERERGTLEGVVASPIRPYELMVGKLLPYLLLGYGDVALAVAFGVFWFKVPLRGSVALLFLLSGVFLTAAFALGLLISTVARSQQVAMLGALLGTLLPSVLLSGFVFPIQSMPTVIRGMTYLIPARYALVVLRGIFLKGVGLNILWPQTLVLLGFALVFLVACSRRFRKRLD